MFESSRCHEELAKKLESSLRKEGEHESNISSQMVRKRSSTVVEMEIISLLA